MANEERFELYPDTHDFLAEELLVPFANQTNNNRLQMFNSHIAQAIQLRNAEVPLVYTGFENQIGNYSTGYEHISDSTAIIKKIQKNEFNYVLIVQDMNTKEYDVIYRTEGHNLTEHFGYKNDNKVIDELEEGEIIEDIVISHDMNYDDEMNFQYGKNLNIAYLSYEGYTNEDSIVISESAARKMGSYFVEKINVNINTNDLLLNLYGNENEYKTFPSIGEEVNEDGILLASRRIIYNDIINKMKDNTLSKLMEDDTKKYTYKGAKVVDIDIYNNSEINSNELYNMQINGVYDDLLAYYTEVVEFLGPIVRNHKNKITNELRNFFNKTASYRDPLTEFENNGMRFDNIVAEFTVIYEKPLTLGAKITQR